MLLNILVQNYYELHGTFDGILDTILRDEILRKTKESTGKFVKTEKSSENFVKVCIGLLGYHEEGKDPDEVMELRKNCALGLKTVEVKEASKQYEIKPLVRQKELVIKGLKGLDDLVAAYYRNEEKLFLTENASIIPFKGWLLHHRSKAIAKVLEDPGVKDCLVTAEFKEGCKPMVYAGKLFLPVKITGAQMMSINHSALSKVMLKSSPVRELSAIPFIDLITLSTKKPELYLRMMDYANALGVTYAEILSWFGIYVPDLIKAYELTGNAIISLDDYCLVYNERNDQWKSYSYEQFLALLRQKALVIDSEKDRRGELNELSSF